MCPGFFAGFCIVLFCFPSLGENASLQGHKKVEGAGEVLQPASCIAWSKSLPAESAAALLYHGMGNVCEGLFWDQHL